MVLLHHSGGKAKEPGHFKSDQFTISPASELGPPRVTRICTYLPSRSFPLSGPE